MTFANAINAALTEAMTLDPDVICYGLGVPDPKGVFGTTMGLQEKFGDDRVAVHLCVSEHRPARERSA